MIERCPHLAHHPDLLISDVKFLNYFPMKIKLHENYLSATGLCLDFDGTRGMRNANQDGL
jgi:hypothetical protein